MDKAGRDVKGEEEERKREKVAVHVMPEGINKLLTGTATVIYAFPFENTLMSQHAKNTAHCAAAQTADRQSFVRSSFLLCKRFLRQSSV